MERADRWERERRVGPFLPSPSPRNPPKLLSSLDSSPLTDSTAEGAGRAPYVWDFHVILYFRPRPASSAPSPRPSLVYAKPRKQQG